MVVEVFVNEERDFSSVCPGAPAVRGLCLDQLPKNGFAMTEWIARDTPEWHVPIATNMLVDVLYEDEAVYTTCPAQRIEWHRLVNPVVLWRFTTLNHVRKLR